MSETAKPFDSREQNLPGRVVSHVKRDAPLVLLDIAVVVPAYMLALVVRLEGVVPPDRWRAFWVFVPVLILAHLLSNFLFGLYGQMWRYASVQEARRLLLAGGTSLILLLGITAILSASRRPLPVSVVIFGCALSVGVFGAFRFQSRLFAFRRREVVEADERTRVLIMGTGDAGAQIVGDVLRHPEARLDVVGLLDDDPRRLGLSLHGVLVRGGRADIPHVVAELGAQQVLLAIPTATSGLIRDVAERCEEAGVSLRVLPSLREMVGGNVTVADLRDLRIEDLLGRQQVQTDLAAVRALLHGRRVLITGAGGSIGSEIARQVAVFGPADLFLLDNDETHLYDLITAMEQGAAHSVLADIRDRARIDEVFRELRPQVVFHAAAHKHVPILETHPHEAFQTNIMGTANVAEAALASGVERFVLISTDKAVRPSSVMGASKRMAEEIVRSLKGRGTVFCSVRFGNVLGSRGSVVPTFLRQIREGGPVTVTDPEMTRYFMSVQEAVQLVLQASSMAKGGDLFTLEMGEPMKIVDLANKLIRLSGRVPGRDIAVQMVGARPGEKRHEELVDDDEYPVASGHPGIVVAMPSAPDPALMRVRLRQMSALAHDSQRAELAVLLRQRDAGAGRLPIAVGDQA